MGANIGTCMTAILSSIGVNRDAKRVTVIHVAIKLIGTVVWLIVFYSVNAFVDFDFLNSPVNIVGVAAIHSVFNIANTILLFPFSRLLVKLAHIIVKETAEEQEFKLDERLMLTPSIAVGECRNMMIKMVNKAKDGLDKSMDMLLNGYNTNDFDYIKKNEEKVDGYEDILGSYLMKLTTTQHLSVDDKNRSSRILQAIGEVERIADHANYLSDSSEEIANKHLEFSDAAKAELAMVIPAVREIYTMALDCYLSNNAKDADNVGPLRIVISEMCDEFKANHVERLANGNCTTEQGFVFNDIRAISEILGERSIQDVALQLDKDSFSPVYRYVIRYIIRHHISACKLLFTLEPASGTRNSAFFERVDEFGNHIRESLRKSDIFMRNSKNQYFVFLSSCSALCSAANMASS